ncbi:hypothetical protein HPULCUR_011668 [Helicostylum pulchrum]|uniref:Uncharacterized protein n=1 Tax=Helicostylum pulchrum TaxID=562976 RepID=A0ABP9YGR0_9FUNG
MASKKNKQNTVRATFHGYIENTRDSLLLFEACKRGIIPRISRRLQDKERHLIKSGSVFCFDENESGIKRWTDGLVWSPSRILGNFLIYRELDDKKLIRSSSADYGMMHGGATNIDENNNNEMLRSRSSSLGSSSTAVTATGYVVAPDHLRRQREKALLGSLKNSYKFKRNGLIKKSMSLIVDGVQQHIISYYSKEDVLSNRLKTPSSIVELSSLEVSPGLCLRQNFRIPIFLSEEISDDRFMEEYQNSNSKRKFSDFSSVPQYEMGSSPSSFASSSSGSSSSNHLISSIDNNQQPSQFFTTSTKAPNRLYTPVTQNNSYSEPRSNKISFNSYKDMQPTVRKKNVSSSSNAMYPAKDINYHDGLRLNTSQYNNHATQLSEQEQQAAMMTNLMKKSFISMNSKPEPHLPVDIIQNNNGSFDKKFSNTSNITSAKSFSNINNKREITNAQYNNDMSMNFSPVDLLPRGGFHASVYNDDFHQGQNPHQHLFSSSSFHTINHAALPNRTEIATNSFMLDMNLLLGTGWNEFELQM